LFEQQLLQRRSLLVDHILHLVETYQTSQFTEIWRHSIFLDHL
jgi:hypothetical protein